MHNKEIVNILVYYLNTIKIESQNNYPNGTEKNAFVKWYRENVFEQIHENVEYHLDTMRLYPEVVYQLYLELTNNKEEFLENGIKKKTITISDSENKKIDLNDVTIYLENEKIIAKLKAYFVCGIISSSLEVPISAFIHDLEFCLENYKRLE